MVVVQPVGVEFFTAEVVMTREGVVILVVHFCSRAQGRGGRVCVMVDGGIWVGGVICAEFGR